MKNINKSIVLLMLIGLTLTSCMSSKYYMKDDEIAAKKYTLDGWDVKRNGEVVGTLTSTEWEIYKNRMSEEISITTSFTNTKEMIEIARFVNAKFPECKIEVNSDTGNTFPVIE